MLLRIAGALQPSLGRVVEEGVGSHFSSRLFSKDTTLWGSDAEPEASIRLGWVDDPLAQVPLAESIDALRAEMGAQGVTRVILCGMGGSSLAPEVMAKAYGVALTVLDTVHPAVVAPLLSSDLSNVVLIVSSKSGGTVETDSLRRMFDAAMTAQGVKPSDRIVVVTDPDSPLEAVARESGYRIFPGDPNIGGRFSALSAFGLVPAGLAGVPLREILDDAHRMWVRLRTDEDSNEGLILGAALAAGSPTRNKILLRDPPDMPGLGNWVEQLIAESTGKHHIGVLPVVGSSLVSLADGVTVGGGQSGADVELEAPLGALFLLWEFATAFACRTLGVNPFDQPNVESAKVAARDLLVTGVSPRDGEKTLGTVSAWASPLLHSDVAGVTDAVRWLLTHRSDSSYIGLGIFGPGGFDEGPWRGVADAIESHTGRPVTLGFGPRFLHSTGQFHKGGPAEGVFLQVIVEPAVDLEIPGRSFSVAELIVAQAHGDAAVLAASGQPVVSLTVSGHEGALALCEALVAGL